MFFGRGLAPGFEVFGEGCAFFAREVGKGLPVDRFFFQERENDVGKGSVEGAFGRGFPEGGAMFLIESRRGFGSQWFPAFNYTLGVGCEVFPVAFESLVRGVFFLPNGQLTESEK